MQTEIQKKIYLRDLLEKDIQQAPKRKQRCACLIYDGKEFQRVKCHHAKGLIFTLDGVDLLTRWYLSSGYLRG